LIRGRGVQAKEVEVENIVKQNEIIRSFSMRIFLSLSVVYVLGIRRGWWFNADFCNETEKLIIVIIGLHYVIIVVFRS
jgi:hypothetical protein